PRQYTTARARAATMATANVAAGRRSAFVIRRLAREGVGSGAESTPDPHDHDADGDDPAHADDECHQTLGHRAVAAQRGAAAVVRVMEVLDVGGDLVGLLVRDRLLAEDRHLARPGAHRLH